MLVYTPNQMRKIDEYAITTLKVPEEYLMDNAASAVFEQIIGIKKTHVKDISVFCGKGNNGADSLILAKKLIDAGYNVKIFIIPQISTIEGALKRAYEKLKSEYADISQFSEKSDISAGIVVDGIFGTGFRGIMPEVYLSAVKQINASGAYIISVDIPSGLDGMTGKIAQYAVRADMTVTFGAPKTGFFLAEGPGCIGELVVSDIGLPNEAFNSVDSQAVYMDKELIMDLLPKRKADSNKGDFGRSLIIAGSDNMPGAGLLSSKAAYRTGAGYVYAQTEKNNRIIYSLHVPELIHDMSQSYNRYNSIAIGPGMGTGERTKTILENLLENYDKNLIIDADAINCIDDPGIIKNRKPRILITPHIKEMSRITDKSIDYIKTNRIDVCREFSQKYNVITVLKGRFTVVSDEQGRAYINPTGNDALAKAGTGDVLTGFAAGFASYIDLFSAALIAVYTHGYCADVYVQYNSPASLLASELIEIMPKVLKSMI